MNVSLTFTTLGELIKEKRIGLGISLSELGRVTGISKGVLSKIESGETKRPELRTLKPIADVLEIRYEEIIERYVDVEHRIDILDQILSESIEISNISLISKVAQQIMKSPSEDTYVILEHLYNRSCSIVDNEVRLVMYDVIIKYARLHGVPKYIAKGLLQKYLIERTDLIHLEDTFKNGEEILHYIDFLDKEEKISLYYKMSFDAHDIKKYEKCIELGKMGHAEDETENELKQRVALAICNSYFRMKNFSSLEEHLKMYEELGYRFIIDRTKTFLSVILSKKGKYQEAIPLLKECVEEATKNNRIHRVNELLEALLNINDVDSIQQVIEREEKSFSFDFNNVYNFSGLGKYFKYKGAFLVDCDLFNEGMESYLQSMYYYSKINDKKGIMKCQEDIYKYHYEKGRIMELPLLKKLTEVYNMVNKGDEKEE
ncbi:helix-turn-helix transcriptional regulator [Brevibacillus laterosporus]|uniref:helix-turn-helix domain-containing protein n=1 Tax=Brevibacillus laterosporus TaxID=1465 RepID=UPI00035DE880|nr:helix-turn-helix transcriptional regulator [Brevibacillus laterosporus]ATO48920.1 transcriptional regulator [Brevibacillus laterosporus DSM 25]MBG9803238.1 DNA-binding protein [Brevibacillus laterosporus]MED2001822.1 helix-turn-helix transcriptional regulator [Brevibacillus laterosporus]MED4764102.1 helix-turn-helix transcriptional regulator [Brevibacillus laterosporus]TPH09128.1 XRE family transcriptional regulator [Brevibacillus laterosporus]